MGATHLTGPVVSPGGFQSADGVAAVAAASRHERISAPIAAEAVSIVAAVLPTNVALTIAAQPDVPRKLRVVVTDADASISAGIVTIVGTDQDGNAATETVSLVGAGTKVTTKAYAHVTSATVSAIAGAAGLDRVSIGVDVALGLPTSKGTVSAFAVGKENVDNADEAVGTVDATARTVAPTTAANGTHNFDFWYSFSVAVA